MADALCGPSNPLQTFQKQTSSDRTLQQDSIASNRQFEQGFRSPPGPNAGVLDAEFEAFQAGRSLADGLPHYMPFAPGPALTRFNDQSSREDAPSWAADFQDLHVDRAPASPIPQSQFRREAPLQHTVPGAWHQEFLRQHTQMPHKQSVHQRLNGGSTNHGVYNDAFNGLTQSDVPFTLVQQRQPDLDQAEMERAFEDVSFEQAELLESLPAMDLVHDIRVTDETRIGSDTILEESAQENQNHSDQDNADELARTAGQLLDNLKHDQSQKFQNSSFLSLMRQIRDREVHVEGDKLVDTPQPLHPGGQHYPADAALKAPFSPEEASEEVLSAMKLA